MVAKTTDELFWGHGGLLVDPYGTFPVTEVGYLEEEAGVSIKIGNEQGKDRVAELDGNVLSKTLSRMVGVSCALKQLTPETFARACGIPYVSTDLEIHIGGQILQSPELAVCVVGTRHDGKPIHVYMPRAIIAEEVTLDMKKREPSKLAVAFDAMDGTHKMVKTYFGRTKQSATIATGAFARTQAAAGVHGIAWVAMSGEGAAADILDDITGSSPSLTNLERIRLQIASTAQPITINHASGVIELKDAADWVMTHLEDWLDLYYETSTTTWKEMTRYDAI